ncbi:MAG: alpha/beta fold hydrolase [Armatimonadetes bacterium]|nr:alpha/beta fold hydrolase [Armatimonadota bacterium]
MAGHNLDLRRWFEHLYAERRRSLSFSPSRAGDLAEWQTAVRSVLIDEMGGWPRNVPPLDPEVTEETDEGAFTRSRVLLRVEEALSVPCWLLVPKGLRPGERRPAILALHGHGNGKDDVVGLDGGQPDRRELIARLNYAYGRTFAEKGYIVLAPDHRNFGERRYSSERLWGRDPCNIVMLKAIMFGRNMLLANVWDARRCIDYLQSREDVNPERIGAVGLSYGGTLTLWLAALDERVKVACVSCYLNSFRAYALSLDNTCGVQTPAAFFDYLDEMWELGALVAPRPLLFESGINDEGFPIDEAKEQFRQVQRVYQLIGAADRVAHDVFDGGHEFSGRLAFDWFAKWLEWH